MTDISKLTDQEKLNRIEELKELIAKKKGEYDYYKAAQLAFKLIINGSYGAFANKHFVASNSNIANAITAHGRDVIQYMLKKIEHYFYYEWHLDKEAHKKLGFTTVKQLDPNPKFETSEEGIYHYIGSNPLTIYGDTDSLYISYTPIMESVGFEHIKDLQKGREFILYVYNNHVKELLNVFLEEYAKPYKVKNLHDFELETISRSSLFIEKKNYLNNIVWEDGISYENMSYFYPKGIEIVRSSTPPFVRGKKSEGGVYNVIRYIFSNPDNIQINEIIKIVKDLKKEFAMVNIEDISMTTSCSNYKTKVINDTSAFECVKGAHFGVKASAFHNFLLNKNSEYKVKYDLIKSGRIKYYYCKHPINEVFAYSRSFHPLEITQKENIVIDLDTQFEKTVLQIVNKFLKPLNLPLINKRISVLNSLFSKKN